MRSGESFFLFFYFEKNEEIEKMKGKIIVCAPTSDRHEYVFDEWKQALDKQTYKNFDILITDTSDKIDYFYKLKKKYPDIRLFRNRWNPKKRDIIQHLADVREQYRQIAIKENYDYIFHLDTDTIIPENGIEKLISFDKDQVGYIVHVFPKKVSYKPPCVFKEGGLKLNQEKERDNGLQYYSWSWVYKNKGKLKKVHATALGVLLVKRKVFKEVAFRTHPTFIYGEDLWYFAEANAKGFEFWCYVKRVPHKNAEWSMVMTKRKTRMSLFFAFGRTDATNAKFVNTVPFIEKEDIKVSIIMPLYNHKLFVGKAINSVLKQQYKNFELIIVNDASTDNSEKVVKKFMKKDKRIKLVTLKKNQGIGIVRSIGAEKSKGDYIAYLSSDDLWKPEFLKYMLSVIKVQPDDMIFCNYDFIDEKDKFMKVSTFFKNTKDYFGGGVKSFKHDFFEKKVREYAKDNNMFVCYDCVLGKAEYFKGKNGFGNFRYGEDLYHLLKCVIKNKIQYTHVPVALAQYRKHRNSAIQKEGVEKLIEHNKMVFKKLKEEGVKGL